MCAVAIDDHPAIKHWVGNVDRPPWSYWLPTSTDRFYPDFIAELTDARIMVIEYKGQGLTDNTDSRQERNIGKRLEEVSEGRVLSGFSAALGAFGFKCSATYGCSPSASSHGSRSIWIVACSI